MNPSNSNSNSSSKSCSLNQLKLNNLPQLKLSHTAKATILSNQIIEFIVEEIKKKYHIMKQWIMINIYFFLYVIALKIFKGLIYHQS